MTVSCLDDSMSREPHADAMAHGPEAASCQRQQRMVKPVRNFVVAHVHLKTSPV